MKKILLLFAAVAALMTSCSNDDITIEEKGDLTFNISTQSVFDKFGLSEPFKERFLGKGYSIGVYTFIYDELGDLVTSDSIHTTTFGKVPIEFDKLAIGEYQAITIEMLVNDDRNYESPNWVIVGQDKITTLSILNKNYTSYWYSAVGVDEKSFSVKNGPGQNIDFTPEPIGCIIDTRMTNFNKSPYVGVNFFTKDQPKGRYLSSSYKDVDRFIYDHYNGSNVWTARGYAFDTNGLSSIEQPTIYLLEEGTIRYLFGADKLESNGDLSNSIFAESPINGSTFEIQDGDFVYGGYHYIGGINQESDSGIFKTIREYESWYNNIKTNTLTFVNPFLTWGANANSVNNYMNQNGMSLAYDGTNGDTYYVGYNNKTGSVMYEYRFNSNKTNLNNVLMGYQGSSFSMEEVMIQMASEYTSEGWSSDLEGYLYYNSNTIALLWYDYENNEIMSLYIPNTASYSPKRKIQKDKILSLRNKNK